MRAMILAAGKGTRMLPYTLHTPKPLLEVAGLPLISHLIINLARAGIKDIMINLGHLGEKIEKKLGDGREYKVQLQYSYEDPILETGGGIAKVLPWFKDAPFLVVSADIYTDYPFEKLIHQPQKKAHVVLTDNPPFHLKGDYALKNGVISKEGSPLYNFAGIGVYTPALFIDCPQGAFPLPFLFNKACNSAEITGEHYSGIWYNIGTPQQLVDLNQHLLSL